MPQTPLLSLACALLLVACGDPAAPEPEGASTGCARTGCPAGERCEANGLCAPDGGGGSGGAGDGCITSDDCWPGPAPAALTLWWDGGQAGLEQICTVRQASCPGGGGCRVPTECLPAAEGLPGSFACDLDEQCASGRCVQTDAVGLCFRACSADADCLQDLAVPGVGFRCGDVEARGVLLRSCVPGDPAQPAATLCRRDCDCSPGAPEPCEPPGAGEARCRLAGESTPPMRAVPVCEVPAVAAPRPTGARCLGEPESCVGGGCSYACNTNTGRGVRHLCENGPFRCTSACTRDADCPARMTCGTGRDGERFGARVASGENDRGRDISYCQLASEGCWDERDCCPVPDGAGGCLEGWSVEPRRCAVVPLGRLPGLLTQCIAIDPAKLPPGACCIAHAECDSALCVPGLPGTACAGGGVCSVPCDPDPAGLAAAGDESDLCSSEALGPALASATCAPFGYELDAGTPEATTIELNVCR